MVKRKRAKARKKAHARRSAAAWGLGDPAELCEMLLGDVDAHALLISTAHRVAEPLLSLLPVDGVDVPVVLIEPTRTGLIKVGQGAYDIRMAIAVKMGLRPAGPPGPPLATGWKLGKSQDEWELFDPTATTIARCKISPDQAADEAAWALQAQAVGQVLVAYGMRVGVRIPEGTPIRDYDDQTRANELGKSLALGQACAAMVQLASVDEEGTSPMHRHCVG